MCDRINKSVLSPCVEPIDTMIAIIRRSISKSPQRSVISITDNAIKQIKKLEKEGCFLKIGVRNKGCSGLMYHFEYVKEKGLWDEEVQQDGIRVLVDSKALLSIIGSEMDYEYSEISSKFKFSNPNVKETCGCGISFSL